MRGRDILIGGIGLFLAGSGMTRGNKAHPVSNSKQ
jgi:hypothetical protein